MKRSVRNSILLGLSAISCLTVGLACSACDADVIPFETEAEKKGPQFLEGALANIYVNDTVVLSEYVDYVNEPYTLTVTDPNGNVQDLSTQVVWYTDAPGAYVFTYTVKSGKSKGTSTFTLNVSYPELTWDFTLKNLPYLFGDVLHFDEYFSDMNITASLENYEVYMDSVEVDGQTINLRDQDSYTFQSMSDHTFKFHAESSDGQRCEGREVISIKYIDAEYMETLTNMGISLYGDLYVEDGNYTMVAGSYCNGNNVWLRRENGPHNLPYVAYNGSYGIGDFVKVDFTGKNMPTLSFFRDEYSQSIFDGTKGFVVTGGFTDNNGNALHPTINNRVMMYGPYMLHEYDRGATDTTTVADGVGMADKAYPGSFNSLDENTRYRLIAGYTGVEKGKANLLGSDPAQSVDTLFLTYQCVILDLDNNEVFSEFKIKTYGIQALGFQEIPLDTENNSFLTGNIVLYGQHGRQTTLDKIYPIITGMSYEEMYAQEVPRATFKSTAKSFILLNSQNLVSDFIDNTQTGYDFFYRDENGVDTPITGETFTFTTEGRYTLFYKYGNYFYGTKSIFVGDLKYNSTMDENGKIVLGEGNIGNGGSYQGPNANELIDQAYVAFTGEYGFNDYVAFDFTGKNMPEIAFFANDFDNSMYVGKGGKKGVVVASGITLWDGSTSSWVGDNGKNVCVSGPYMANFNAANKESGGNLMNSFASKLARENLVDGVRYRIIMGFTEGIDARSIVLKYALYNLDTGELIEEDGWDGEQLSGKTVSWNMFSNSDFFEQDRSTLKGSIVLYGKFKATTTIDKWWGVYEDTTVAAVKSAIESN